MNNSSIVYCKDCKFSVETPGSGIYGLFCTNSKVNATNPAALGAPEKFANTRCESERGKYFFAACGIKGKQWSAK